MQTHHSHNLHHIYRKCHQIFKQLTKYLFVFRLMLVCVCVCVYRLVVFQFAIGSVLCATNEFGIGLFFLRMGNVFFTAMIRFDFGVEGANHTIFSRYKFKFSRKLLGPDNLIIWLRALMIQCQSRLLITANI